MTSAPFEHPVLRDYALLDSGNGEKLERFGELTLRRPDPQAIWSRRSPPERWHDADLTFVRESDRGGRWESREDAHPQARSKTPEWTLTHREGRFLVRPTPFKHVGFFPEQATNWDFVARAARAFETPPRLLNLFGYTGVASVLAKQAGYDVTHVDASKLALAWTRENAVASGLAETSLRIVLEDALAFARREVRRGERYDAILVDPPHYGRGPKGEKWQFESGIGELIEAARGLLADRSLLILSTYAIGISPSALANLVADLGPARIEAGELLLPDESGERPLSAGFCARWIRGLELP